MSKEIFVLFFIPNSFLGKLEVLFWLSRGVTINKLTLLALEDGGEEGEGRAKTSNLAYMASFSLEIPTDHIFPYAYIALLNVRKGISFLAHISTPEERENKNPLEG